MEGHYTEVDAGITVYPFGIGGSNHLGLRVSYLLHRIQVSANDAEVDIVWDPPWTPEMLRPEAKELLAGLM